MIFRRRIIIIIWKRYVLPMQHLFHSEGIKPRRQVFHDLAQVNVKRVCASLFFQWIYAVTSRTNGFERDLSLPRALSGSAALSGWIDWPSLLLASETDVKWYEYNRHTNFDFSRQLSIQIIRHSSGNCQIFLGQINENVQSLVFKDYNSWAVVNNNY